MFDHETLKVYFRDRFVDFKDANVSIANTGFMYGLGVFSGIRAHYNREQAKLYIFRADEHYKRFLFACKVCDYKNFPQRFSFEHFQSILKELLRLNQIREDAYIRIAAYTDETKITPKFHGYKDAFCAFLYAIGDYVPTSGMRCMVSSWTRIEDNAIPSRAKIHGAYVNSALARAEAANRGFDEALFLDRDGHVVEGSAENIFLVMDGALVTPPLSANILEGITRKSVMKLAADLGIETIERNIDRSELYKADEVFLTGTGAQVSPVTQIDAIAVGNGETGPVSRRLQEAYFRAVRGFDARYSEWLTEV